MRHVHVGASQSDVISSVYDSLPLKMAGARNLTGIVLRNRPGAETDRIKHGLEGVLITLEVSIGRDENKEQQAFRALDRDQPIRFATSQRGVVCDVSGLRILPIDPEVIMLA